MVGSGWRARKTGDSLSAQIRLPVESERPSITSMRRLIALLAVSALILAWIGISKFRGPAVTPPAAKPSAALAPPKAVPAPSVAAAEPAPALEPETDAQREWRLKRYGNIPREKLARVEAIARDYGQLLQQILAQNRGAPDGSPSSRAIKLLRREQRADLLAVLTPAEVEEYEMHSTPSGMNLVDSLKEVSTTEEERRALYRLRDEFDSRYGSGHFTASEAAMRERSRVAMYEQMRAVLGDERYTVYLKRDDLAYKRFTTIAEDLRQPASVADQLWRIKSEYFIRRGDLPPFETNREAWRQQDTMLLGEFRSRVVALVGEKALSEYPAAFEWLPERKPAAPASVSPP
jgi:hypothetical protein